MRYGGLFHCRIFGLVSSVLPGAIINGSDESNLYFKAIHAVTGCYSLLVSSFYHFPLVAVLTISGTHTEDLGVYGKI